MKQPFLLELPGHLGHGKEETGRRIEPGMEDPQASPEHLGPFLILTSHLHELTLFLLDHLDLVIGTSDCENPDWSTRVHSGFLSQFTPTSLPTPFL